MMSDEPLIPPVPATKPTAHSQDGSTEGTLVQSPEAVLRTAAESRGIADTLSTNFDYEIANELGRGAMGVVYLARHTKLNRHVALKMAVEGRVAERDLIRFLAEAEAVAAVRHSNVVQVYDYGEVDGRPYMALEFCPGGSLAQRLEKSYSFPPKETAELLRQVATGVAAAHEEGIVHRDLKPANVLLTGLGEPKVADFGIAKRTGRDLTATQAVMGTPFYMAPEQAGGRAKFVGPQADVWALGVMLYECLSGVRPFGGETNGEIFANIIGREPPSLHASVRDMPRDLELICHKCLEKNPNDRYPTAKELANDLNRYTHGEPISVRPLSATARLTRWGQRNPAVAGLLAAVIVVTVGLLGSLWSQYRQALAQARIELNVKETELREQHKTALLAKAEDDKKAASLLAAAQKKHSAEQEKLVNDLIALQDDLFRSSDPLGGFFGDAMPTLAGNVHADRAATLQPFLRNAASRFRATLTDPRAALVRAKLLASIGNGMKNIGMFAEGKDVLAEALSLRRANLPETHPDVLRSELDLGRLEAESGDFLGGIARFRKVLALQMRANADPGAMLNTRLYEGLTLTAAGLTEAGPILREVVRERERLNGKKHKDTLLAKLALITWLLEQHESAEVLRLFGEFRTDILAVAEPRVREIFESIFNCQAKLAMANLADSSNTLGLLTRQRSVAGIRTDITRLEKLLPDHLILIVFRFELAKVLSQLGEDRETDELCTRILADTRRTVGLAHPKMLVFLKFYMPWLARHKRADEARTLFDEAEAANLSRFGPENPWRSVLLLVRTEFEQKQGDAVKSRALAKKATNLISRGKFITSDGALAQLFETAKALGGNRDVATRRAAHELFAALRSLVVARYKEASPEFVIFLTIEGKFFYNSGDRVAAAANFDHALALLPAVTRLLPIDRVTLLFWCGRVELDRGRFTAAEQHFRSLRDTARSISDYSIADRREDALYLARAVAAQGHYKEAVPLFEEARRLTSKIEEKNLAWADMQVATAQFAAGDVEAHRKCVAAMFVKYGKSKDGNTLVRLAWASGLGGLHQGWKPSDVEAALAASSFRNFRTFPWGYRGLALIRLRAGDFAGMEAALAKAGKEAFPVDYLIRGLAATARNDYVAARSLLAQAEELIARQMAAKKPFPFAGQSWNQHLEATILSTELRARLAPPVAPMPRAKG